MPLKLIPPGKRKNKHWYMRGTVNGREFEGSTGTALKAEAERIKTEWEYQLSTSHPDNAVMTFQHAADSYMAFKKPKDYDVKRIERLCQIIGERPVNSIQQDDLVKIATTVKRRAKPGTQNRDILVPLSAVMHYAANNKWCDWQRFKRFKEPSPKTRYAHPATEEWLLLALQGEPKRQLLVQWLFRQGDRITDILGVKFEDCDMKAGTVHRYISKTDKHVVLPLDDEIWAALKAETNQHGYIFPWRTKWGVYRWLKPLVRGLEIPFTPHMARHSVGKRLSDEGTSLRTIMAKLAHNDVRSSLRYQAEDVETIRAASRKTVNRGKSGEAA